VCVCVCVCVREREREKKENTSLTDPHSITNCTLRMISPNANRNWKAIKSFPRGVVQALLIAINILDDAPLFSFSFQKYSTYHNIIYNT